MPGLMPSAVRAWVEREFGGPTTEQESLVTVPAGNVVVQLVPNNAERVSLVFVNDGGNLVAISLTNATGSSGGIGVNGNGGAITMNVRDDSTLPSRQWVAASSLGSTVYCLEVIRSIYTPPSEVPPGNP